MPVMSHRLRASSRTWLPWARGSQFVRLLEPILGTVSRVVVSSEAIDGCMATATTCMDEVSVQ